MTHTQILRDALSALVASLSDHDDEGMIEHAQQMIDARAALRATEQADVAPDDVEQSRQLWEAALGQAAFYVNDHCKDGEYHAEAIMSMPMPKITATPSPIAGELTGAMADAILHGTGMLRIEHIPYDDFIQPAAEHADVSAMSMKSLCNSEHAKRADETPWEQLMADHYAKGNVTCHPAQHFMGAEIDAWRARAQQQQAGAVEGWQMVPKKPTEAMIAAYLGEAVVIGLWDEYEPEPLTVDAEAKMIHSAMLAAAPTLGGKDE